MEACPPFIPLDKVVGMLMPALGSQPRLVDEVLDYAGLNSITIPDGAEIGPVVFDRWTGALGVSEKRWRQNKQWELKKESIIFLRYGSAVHGIGVKNPGGNPRDMIGDRYSGKLVKIDANNVLGVMVFVGHPPGQKEIGIVGISFRREENRWSRRYGGTDMTLAGESWPVKYVQEVIPPPAKPGTQWHLTKLQAFSSSRISGMIGAVKISFELVDR
mmetsp:Transcript_10457/g.25546  ORF Transcript_10457/g.25546 Transcript_10457/m.25546 type:complete len:216 (-) Transcript_10457:82-729(-)